MKKFVLATLFLFTLCQAPAQPCAPGSHTWPDCKPVDDAKRVVSTYATIIPPTSQATKATQELMNAYFILGEEGLDDYLNTMDASWYSGIDVYLHYNKGELIDMIRNDAEAEFRLNGKATVTVADDGINYLIVVYSFP